MAMLSQLFSSSLSNTPPVARLCLVCRRCLYLQSSLRFVSCIEIPSYACILVPTVNLQTIVSPAKCQSCSVDRRIHLPYREGPLTQDMKTLGFKAYIPNKYPLLNLTPLEYLKQYRANNIKVVDLPNPQTRTSSGKRLSSICPGRRRVA
jgi:hypothetical protein